jgi:hypothetical protein
VIKIDNFTVLHVHDGDSFTVDLPDVTALIPYCKKYIAPTRLLGVNAAELNQVGGAKARDVATEFLGTGKNLVLWCYPMQEKYGRLLVDVYKPETKRRLAEVILTLPESKPIALIHQLAPK